MRKKLPACFAPVLPLLLTGCGTGQKTGSLAAVYGAMALLAAILLVAHILIGRERKVWTTVLFISILVVNFGYFALAVSRNLADALMANRLAYLGSVFLPLSMWMILAKATRLSYPKWLPQALIAVSAAVFCIAATPGICPLYYREVTFTKVNGVTVLVKNYGPLHWIYLVFLLGYFAAMIATLLRAAAKRRLESPTYGVILAIATMLNILVWGIEQLVDMEFEILSVSYIISGSFLLSLRLLMAEAEKQRAAIAAAAPKAPPAQEAIPAEQLELFRAGLPTLTPKEREIYESYLSGMTTAQIMEALSIKENTLKFHNKNIYSKLGVTSRKQLLRCAAALPQPTEP